MAVILLLVRLVLSENQAAGAVTVEPVAADVRVLCLDDGGVLARPALHRVGRGASGAIHQRLWNQRWGNRCSVAFSGPTVRNLDANQEVSGAGLGVLDEDVEIAVLGTDTGARQPAKCNAKRRMRNCIGMRST